MNESENWWLLLETNFDTLSYDLQQYLYNEFHAFAYQEIIFLLKDHALAEDIIQEAFLKVTNKRSQLTNAASKKAWTRRIIRNQLIDTIRKQNRHKTNLGYVYKKSSDHLAYQEVSASVEDIVEMSHRNQILHETILGLKPEFSTILLKFYMEEKSYKEIATELEISDQVVAQRLARAKKALLSQFSEKWSDENDQ